VGGKKDFRAGNAAITRQFMTETIMYFLVSTVIATGVCYHTTFRIICGHPIHQVLSAI
jgi:putative ABC transport system permease protein